MDVVRRVDVPEVVARHVHPSAGAFDEVRAGGVHAEPPLHDVDVVRTPVGDHAPAVRRELDPAWTRVYAVQVLRVAARLVVRHRRIRRAKPRLVVKVRRNRLRTPVAAGFVYAESDLDALDIADDAFAHGTADSLELPPRALMRADLHDGVVLLGKIREEAALLDRLRERLLQPDRLAGADGGSRDERVPEVRNRNHHRVDVLACADFLVVLVNANLRAVGIVFLYLVGHVFRALRVEIADGYETGDILASKNARHLKRVGNPSTADYGHVNLPVRAETVAASAEEHRSRARREHSADETAPVHFVHSVFSF